MVNRILLAGIILLALVGFSSIPTQAQPNDVVDLQLGGEGAQAWNIGNILPGDSGTKAVTLHNAGTANDAYVTIWISAIASTEGTNPEPETNTAEPGELLGHLQFNLACSRLSTNISLPTQINNFPQSASDPNYIKIIPLNAGDTVDLDWYWQLPPQTGNEAQGDVLSFTINYMLAAPGPPPGPPGGGGAGAGAGAPTATACPLSLSVSMLGNVSTTTMSYDGVLCCPCVALDAAGRHILELDAGTQLLCSNGQPPRRIEFTLAGSPPAPSDAAIVGPIYEINAYLYERSLTPYPVTISPAGTMALSYNPDDMPENVVGGVVIAYYDEEAGQWVTLETAGWVAAEGEELRPNTVVSHISHCTYFTLLVKLGTAKFETTNLTINPGVTEPDQEVTISVDVANAGGTAGEYDLQLVIDGIARATRGLILDPQTSQTVTFRTTGDPVGKHHLEVGNLSGEFEVEQQPVAGVNWWLIGGILGAVAVASSVTWATWWRRRLKGDQAGLPEQSSSSG